jgi:hypothetical protein
MITSLLEMAKKQLASQDQIVKSYRIRWERKDGWLVLSKRKAIYLDETGFFRKTYNPLLEIPYDSIKNIATLASHTFEIEEANQKKHVFTSFGAATATHIKADLNKLVSAGKLAAS